MSSERFSFAHLIQTFSFVPSELSRVGDVIGQVRAVDIDEDSQAEVFYQITSGNQKGMQRMSCLCTIPIVDLLKGTSKILKIVVVTSLCGSVFLSP